MPMPMDAWGRLSAAVELGETDALRFLGRALAHGHGCARDAQRALAAFTRAAELGDAIAQ